MLLFTTTLLLNFTDHAILWRSISSARCPLVWHISWFRCSFIRDLSRACCTFMHCFSAACRGLAALDRSFASASSALACSISSFLLALKRISACVSNTPPDNGSSTYARFESFFDAGVTLVRVAIFNTLRASRFSLQRSSCPRCQSVTSCNST
ncbi:hypothetical protein PF004_g1593 [Phytophthora fragariae]|uniref:Secreted protein n=1 Tax=Phytophthora fragariae TaxID=53985 RepID=A0A6G0PSF0_9STRA|nr:hypothetical protein PF004_g1593 [Phytophthora fragariae]